MALSFSLLLLACVSVFIVENAHGACNPKHIGGDTPVCVCSDSEKCTNDLAHLNSVSKDKGSITAFITNKHGDRFKAQSHKFSPTAPAASKTFQYNLEVDRTKRHQKILGFGGAFTDSAGIMLNRLPKELQEQVMRDYFSPNGLEYNMARVPIGGSDFSTRPYTYDDHPVDESLKTFALQPEDFDYKIPMIKWAYSLSRYTKEQLKWYGYPWSPPSWMKTNHEINHGGYLLGHPGGQYYELYANYTVRFLEEYAKLNITFWGLTMQNEPLVAKIPNYRLNSLGFTPETQRDYIKLDIGPALHAAGFGSIQLMHYDHNLSHLKEWVDKILGDQDAAKYLAGTAYHWYERKNHHYPLTLLGEIAKKFPDKILLNTEGCLYYTQMGEMGVWENFNEYASDIMQVLNQGVQGWVDWNLLLNMTGGPSWANTVVYAPIHVSDNGTEFYRLPMFYAMGHFSKFIVPDSVRLELTIKPGLKDTSVLFNVFERPDKSTVLSMLNTKHHNITVKMHDPAHGYLTLDVGADSMETHIWY